MLRRMKSSNTTTVQNGEAGNFDMVRLSKSKATVDLSPNTIRNFAEQGLRLYRHGKMVFFSKTELAALIRTKATVQSA
jgi:hypothetical protein